MSELTDSLKNKAAHYYCFDPPIMGSACAKAAAEIERLTAENERLRAALGEIANYCGAKNDDAEPCREIARCALDQQNALRADNEG